RVAVAPHPTPMEVAGLGADADAAEVHVVADVDGEPAPHGRAAPAPGPPRLVAVAARVGPQGMTLVVDLDPPRPAPGLLEMALAHGAARCRAGPVTLAALPVGADRGHERGERHVERDRHRGVGEL